MSTEPWRPFGIDEAEADLGRTRMNDAADLAFWATRAAGYLEPLLAAAMLTGQGAGTVAGWITWDATAEAEDILRAHGLGDAADRLAELRIEPRLAAESISTAMTAALARQALPTRGPNERRYPR